MASPTNSNRYLTEHFFSAYRKGPEWFLYEFSPSAGLFRFIRMTEGHYMDSTFLDDRIERPDGSEIWTPVPFASEVTEAPKQPLGLLFHTSFCGSTLFARVLHQRGGVFALREPLVLFQLASMSSTGRSSQGLLAIPMLIRWAMACLRRPLTGYQCTLIKPSNLAFSIAPTIVRESPRTRFIVLYQSLRSFLVSCLKKPPDTQRKIIALARSLSAKAPEAFCYEAYLRRQKDEFTASATVFWDLQMRAYELLLWQSDCACSLNFDSVADHLPEAISEVARFLYPSVEGIDGNLDYSHLNQNAKEPKRRYSSNQRREEQRVVERTYGDRLRTALGAADGLFRTHGEPRPGPALGA